MIATCSTLKRHCVLSTCVNHLRCILKSLLTVEYLFSHLTLKAPTIPKKKRYSQNLDFYKPSLHEPNFELKDQFPNLKKGRNPHIFPCIQRGRVCVRMGCRTSLNLWPSSTWSTGLERKIARILFSLKTEGHKALAHGLSRTFGQKICSIFKTVFELIVVSYNFFLSDHVFFLPSPLSGNPLLYAEPGSQLRYGIIQTLSTPLTNWGPRSRFPSRKSHWVCWEPFGYLLTPKNTGFV